MDLPVLNTKGKKNGKNVKMERSIFEIKPNDHSVYLDVKHYMANKRQGTSKTKERGEITGSRRKIKRQKGTGSARFGDIKNPIFRGGGRIFGPVPRKYGSKLNKKLKVLARKTALSYKLMDKSVTIIEDFSFYEPKTGNYVELMRNLELSDKKTLLVLPKPDENIRLSSRNLKKIGRASCREMV